MQNFGNNTRGGGPMRRATRMQRVLDGSSVFKVIRDENSGLGRAPRWRKRYKLIGTDYYLYLLFDERYRVQKGKGGPFVDSSELKEDISKEAQEVLRELSELEKEIHNHSEE